MAGRRNARGDVPRVGTILDGLPLIGTGDLGSRIWSGPAITVIGLDAPSVDGAVNAVSPYARDPQRARAPGPRCRRSQRAVIAHLEAQRPLGSRSPSHPAPSATATRRRPMARPSRRRVRRGLRRMAARPSWRAAAARFPWSRRSPRRRRRRGAGRRDCDGFANIHGPNERVLLDEFERTVVAEVDWMDRYAAAVRGLKEVERAPPPRHTAPGRWARVLRIDARRPPAQGGPAPRGASARLVWPSGGRSRPRFDRCTARGLGLADRAAAGTVAGLLDRGRAGAAAGVQRAVRDADDGGEPWPARACPSSGST